MLKRYPIIALSIALAIGACADEDNGGMETSSSSHWAECDSFADCRSVAGAVACESGYCVGETGGRLRRGAAPSSPDGSAGSGGRAPVTVDSDAGLFDRDARVGRVDSSRFAPDSEPVSIRDGGARADSPAPVFGTDGSTPDARGALPEDSGACPVRLPNAGVDLSSYKSCQTDDDCVIDEVLDCCGGVHIFGIHRDRVAAFDRCVPDQEPVCDCLPPPTTAEDGRLTNGDWSNVEALCVDNACTTRVIDACGDATEGCPPGELCASFTDNIGPTSTTTYLCAPNPCEGRIGCNCGQSVCDDTRSSPYPVCAPGPSGVDLHCDDGRQ